MLRCGRRRITGIGSTHLDPALDVAPLEPLRLAAAQSIAQRVGHRFQVGAVGANYEIIDDILKQVREIRRKRGLDEEESGG